MSFETIRIYRDYPIINNKVQIDGIESELNESDALIAYNNSDIVEFGFGYDRQEFLRLSPIIPGNQDE